MNLQPKGIALAVAVALPIAIFLGLILGPGLDARTSAAAPVATSSGPGPASPARIEIVFRRSGNDTVRVADAATDRILRTFGPGEGGFLRGILRPLERERERYGASPIDPYELVREPEGRVVLRDPATDLEVDVAAFGGTSLALFHTLLDGGPEPSVPSLLR